METNVHLYLAIIGLYNRQKCVLCQVRAQAEETVYDRHITISNIDYLSPRLSFVSGGKRRKSLSARS
jgi:hypothetical protein